jgi:hypothetical protein
LSWWSTARSAAPKGEAGAAPGCSASELPGPQALPRSPAPSASRRLGSPASGERTEAYLASPTPFTKPKDLGVSPLRFNHDAGSEKRNRVFGVVACRPGRFAVPIFPQGHLIADPQATADHRPPCPCCGGRMIIIEIFQPGVQEALHEYSGATRLL